MAIPNVRGALRGWMKLKTVSIMTQTVVDFETVFTSEDISVKMNIQPMPSEKVNQKPEESRAWKWQNVWIQDGPLLKIDDKIEVDGKKYQIKSVDDWTEGGYQHYEAIEEFVIAT